MLETIIIGSSLLLILSILASKISDRFGVPALLLFLGVGMLAGSEAIGGIYFDDPGIAQFVGVIALVFILFSGGLDTEWKSIRPVLKQGLSLSTLGVCLTAVIIGLFAGALLGFSPIEGLLLGAIVSSTDAAAVFSILRSKGISLRGNLKPLLELESGSNDPMAVFLTISFLQLVQQPATNGLWELVLDFSLQMVLGVLLGYAFGRGIQLLANRLNLGYEGLYPVLTVALVLLTYGVTNKAGGNGFLAVYLAGIVAGNRDFIHKRSLMRFHDGLAWLMQIAMFLTLGLLVFPSRLIPVSGVGLVIAAGLMLVARPVSVIIGLSATRLSLREKLFVAWVGLRGAAPIVLATFPLLARIPQAELIFNVVFFVVLTSVLFQGTTIARAARWLHVDAPVIPKRLYPIEYNRVEGLKSELKELPIPKGARVAGRAIVELGLPDEFLIVLIARGEEFILPSGGIILQEGDILIVLSENEAFQRVERLVAGESSGLLL